MPKPPALSRFNFTSSSDARRGGRAAEASSSAVLGDDPHSLPLGLSGSLARAASMELLPGEGARAWPARSRGSRDALRRPLGDGEAGSGL